MESKQENNVVWHHATITRRDRELRNGHRSAVVWFTGLPNSGKSTIAHAVEEKLFRLGCRTFVFDGDNVRHGLCSDLGFSNGHRGENIRRIAEMSKLFVEAGIIALTAFISPFRKDRQRVRDLLGDAAFIEIYCRCPIEICEQRDVKGHYQAARTGKITEFTGVSSPYEEPEQPDLIIETGTVPLGAAAAMVLDLLGKKGIIFSQVK